ncbi:Glutathionyl-hydroquinone reductase YqjG [Trichoplax sp. H2]|nr:Glutathionyl-hydroquinone reductase YqjG [Trichoplax sp. H2]|eukprot:RDD43596.1 Glutathionyl-hydroquinone reductase YqjG [Trichoplax sp. H2]
MSDQGSDSVKKITSFNGRVSKDGSGQFPAQKGRYHLYVNPGCPYAQRVMIMRTLKGLEDIITMDITHWYIHENGWFFDETVDTCTKDTVNGFKFLREAYEQTNTKYSGRITVPVLYDKVNKVIVNNESAEIMEILNSEFNEFCSTQEHKDLNLYSKEHEETAKELLGWITPNIISRVFRVRDATNQESYYQSVDTLFENLDRLEKHLSNRRYLTGKTITHADVKLFVALVRFDVAYYVVYKCNTKRIADYPNIWGYLRDLYQSPGFGETVNIEHIMKLHYVSDKKQKPTKICPKGPVVDFTGKHGREALASA